MDVGWVGSVQGVRPKESARTSALARPLDGRRPRELSNRRPGKALRRLEVALRPSPAQGQTGNSSVKPSSESPGTRPLNSTSRRGLHPVPPPAVSKQRRLEEGPTPPTGLRCATSRGATSQRGAAVRVTPRRPRDVPRRPTPPRPVPTHPALRGRRSGRDRASPLPRPRSYPSFRLAL